MRVAITLVKEGLAQACVSAGNTGALMATARFVLKTIPGIDRPAIAKLMPRCAQKPACWTSGRMSIARLEQMLQFGIMGATLMADAKGPRQSARARSILARKTSGQWRGQAGWRIAAPVQPEFCRQMSKATIFTAAQWTWWCATASPAMWR